MADPVVHFEVLGDDGDALNNFYTELFGWETTSVEAMNYHIVTAVGAGIGGGIGAAQDGPGHVTFYVAVDDLDAALEKVGSLGGSTVVPPMDIPDGDKIALFKDPEGHTIGLFNRQT